jgi:hypothetical protein
MKPSACRYGSAWSSVGQAAMPKDGNQWRGTRSVNGVTEPNGGAWRSMATASAVIAPRRSPVRARLAPSRKALHIAAYVFHAGDKICGKRRVVKFWSSSRSATERARRPSCPWIDDLITRFSPTSAHRAPKSYWARGDAGVFGRDDGGQARQAIAPWRRDGLVVEWSLAVRVTV